MNYLVLAVAAVCVVLFPPVTTLLAMVFGEVFVLQMTVLQTGYERVGLQLLGLAASIVCCTRLAKEAKAGKCSPRLVVVATASMALPLWVGISVALGPAATPNLVAEEIGRQPCHIMAVVLFYFRFPWLRKAVLALAVLQLVLALLIFVQPDGPMGQLSSTSIYEGPGGSGDFVGLSSMQSGEFAKRPAQFTNAVSLAFVIAVVMLGAVLLSEHGWVGRISGSLLILASLCGLFNAFLRGVCIGLVAGILSYVLIFRRKWIVILLFLAPILAFVASRNIAGSPSRVADPTAPVIEQIMALFDPEQEAYRREALASVPGQIVKSPWTGTGGILAYRYQYDAIAHQLILFMSVVYGLPAGILCCYFSTVLLLGFSSAYARERGAQDVDVTLNHKIAVLAAPLCLIVSLTNHQGGGYFQWILWAFAVAPWATIWPASYRARHKPPRQRTLAGYGTTGT